MSNKRSLISAAASVVPVPFTDIATDVVLLKQIIPGINEKFGLSIEQVNEYNPRLAILVYDVTKRFGTNMIGKYITKELLVTFLKKLGFRFTTREVAKYVPVIGQIISAGISFTAMRMIIHSHINQCYKVAKILIESQKPDNR